VRALGVAALLPYAGVVRAAVAQPAGRPVEEPAQPVRRLSLASALRIAAVRQPALARARAGLAGAEARASAARSQLLPQVLLSADLSGTNAPTRVSRTGAGAVGGGGTGADSTGGGTGGAGGTGGVGSSGSQAGFRSNFSTTATLEQAVFRPRLNAQAAAARAEARVFRADAEQVSLDVAFTVVDAYYAQVRAERLVGVQEEQLREASRTARDLAARFRTGAGRRVDALRADVQRALAEVAVREARAVAAQAATALVAALGVPPGARDSAYALDSVVPRPAPAPASLDSLVTVAEAASPTLRAAAAVVDVRRATVRAARADLLPAVSARGGLGYQQSDLSPRAPFTTFGLSLAWPAFTSGAQQALVRAAEAETRLAEAELEVTRNELRRRLAAAQARWREAERRSQAAAASVAAAREAVGILDAAFREGAVLLVEVFTARTDLARAASGEVQALVDAQVARAELALTLGRVPDA
jgi:outer membrane protein TolC